MDVTSRPCFVLGITGASGVIYGIRTLKALLELDVDVHLIVSASGASVLTHEMGSSDILCLLQQLGVKGVQDRLAIHAPDDFFTPPASGSFRHNGMIIAPCAMRSIGNLASGIGDNLLHRAGDVALKERRPLILVPRETPFNRIHLENLLRLQDAGATILPAAPSFYHQPASVDALVDTVVARILDHLRLPQNLMPQWKTP